jgi:hypothetical protein
MKTPPKILLLTLPFLWVGCSSLESDYRSAAQQDRASAWNYFLKNHPGSKYDQQAKDKLMQAEYRDACNKKSTWALRKFARDYPSTTYAAEATKRLEALERDDQQAWERAKSTGTYEAYYSYLLAPPAGAHRVDAMRSANGALTNLALAAVQNDRTRIHRGADFPTNLFSALELREAFPREGMTHSVNRAIGVPGGERSLDRTKEVVGPIYAKQSSAMNAPYYKVSSSKQPGLAVRFYQYAGFLAADKLVLEVRGSTPAPEPDALGRRTISIPLEKMSWQIFGSGIAIIDNGPNVEVYCFGRAADLFQ